MKRWLVVLGFLWWWVTPMSTAWADDLVVDEPSLMNDAPNAWEEFKKSVDILEPTVEMVYDFHQQEWEVGTSASLYSFTSNAVHLGRIKAGYLASNAPYAGVDVDLPGFVTRFLGGKWTQVDKVLGVVGKYASTGFVAGYDVEAAEVIYGPTFGATLRF